MQRTRKRAGVIEAGAVWAIAGLLAGIAALLFAGFRSRKPRVRAVGVSSALYASAMVALTGYSLVRVQRAGLEMNGHKWALDRIVQEYYKLEIVRTSAALLGVGAGIGLLLGGGSAGAVCLRDALVPVHRRPQRFLVWRSLRLAAVAHAGFFLADLAARPFLYEHVFEGSRSWRKLHWRLARVLGQQAWKLVCGGLAVWLIAPLRGDPPGPGALFISGSTALAICIRLLLTRRRRRPQPASAAPNILLIAADSLRADRIHPRTAPFLTALADRSVVFERAYVTIARTMPSWVTLLTGRFPHSHGVRHMFSRWEARWRDLGAIPERFAAAGYHTAAVSDYAGDHFPRVRLGFQVIDTPTFTFRELVRHPMISQAAMLHPFLRHAHDMLPDLRALPATADAQVVTRRALKLLDRIEGQPFFLTVFYSNSHFPYAAPAPYHRKFIDPLYRGPYRYGKEFVTSGTHEPITADDIRQVRALYDGAVAGIDDAVRSLIEGLRERELDRNTILVITSDHGEALYEDGRGQGHGDHLFGDQSLHIPLIISTPQQNEVRRIKDIVRDVDLAPTLCELAGLPPAPRCDGRSLVPLLRGEAKTPVPAFAETEIWFDNPMPVMPSELRVDYADVAHLTEIDREHDDEIVIRRRLEGVVIESKHRMMREERFKLLYIPTSREVRWLLFDMVEDPAELEDVSARYPKVLERMKAKLWQWMAADKGMERRGERLRAVDSYTAALPGISDGILITEG